MNTNLRQKAIDAITDERVVVRQVNGNSAMVEVRSEDSSKVRDVYFHPGSGWTCDCPATATCYHIYAGMLITDLHIQRDESLYKADPDIDKLFETIKDY